MHWRNEQIYHLRQAEPLTREQQDVYFEKVVAALFSKEQPEQLLFSYLEQSECIGYGGLVHIDWRNRHAEISFIMKTELEPSAFQFHWGNYLSLIEEVAFQELQLHKIYTYAYDLRPHLYDALELAGYQKEATLKEHCFFNGRFIDVIVHAKYA
jgi:RimJ/RimL family protein N-acetyltransferase